MPANPRITNQEYQSLADIRYVIRRFLSFSAQEARNHGLEPQQHQLLLAIRGLPADQRPTIRVLAERLALQHHSVVELAKRTQGQGLLDRCTNPEDHREVFLRITRSGERVLRQLTLAHRKELRATGPTLLRALEGIMQPKSASGVRK